VCNRPDRRQPYQRSGAPLAYPMFPVVCGGGYGVSVTWRIAGRRGSR
jgi:hypothetical protein